jgi:hypothetical protein
MRTLHAHFYLELVLSTLCITFGMYLLRDVFTTSGRDTSPSLLVGAVLVTGGIIFVWWSINTYAMMKSWEGAARTAGHHGSRMRGKS